MVSSDHYLSGTNVNVVEFEPKNWAQVTIKVVLWQVIKVLMKRTAIYFCTVKITLVKPEDFILYSVSKMQKKIIQICVN